MNTRVKYLQKEKAKNWKYKLKNIQKTDIPRAKLETSYIIDKLGGDPEDIIESEEKIESLQKNADSIKKVIKKLRKIK
jgi:hypothetical protein